MTLTRAEIVTLEAEILAALGKIAADRSRMFDVILNAHDALDTAASDREQTAWNILRAELRRQGVIK